MSIFVVSRKKPDFFESDASDELMHYLGRVCDEQVSAVRAMPKAAKTEDTVVMLGDSHVQTGELLPNLEGDAIQISDRSVTPDKLSAQEQASTRKIARRMVDVSHEYIRHYQKWMFDRGDEGLIVSYYMTATRYAWKYAYPEQDDATGRFCDLSKAEAEEARRRRRKQRDEAVIHAPEMDWKK